MSDELNRQERGQIQHVPRVGPPITSTSLRWSTMRKVAVVGCGGSGKSHVARELGRILDAPVTHLDAAFYDDRWNALPIDKFTDVQRGLVAQPRWVIDGNYNSTLQVRLEACDTVSSWTCRPWRPCTGSSPGRSGTGPATRATECTTASTGA